jgi:hypothetical protein
MCRIFYVESRPNVAPKMEAQLLGFGKDGGDLAGGVVDDHDVEESVAVEVACGNDRDTWRNSKREDSANWRALPQGSIQSNLQGPTLKSEVTTSTLSLFVSGVAKTLTPQVSLRDCDCKRTRD